MVDAERRFRPWWRIVLFVLVTIAILASFIIPSGHFDQFPPNALSDIRNAETTFTGMLSDTQVGRFSDFFDADAFAAVHSQVQASGLNAFDAATHIYSVAFHQLLTHGRNAAPALAEELGASENVLRDEVVAKLGPGYMDLRDDPWGQPYRVFVGPWPEAWGIPVFRIREVVPGRTSKTPAPDALTVHLPDGSTTGYPAPRDLPIYIWSLGKNRVSDQPTFDPTGAYHPPAQDHYRAAALLEFLGGGDDINNWDPGRSWQSFYDDGRGGSFGCQGRPNSTRHEASGDVTVNAS